MLASKQKTVKLTKKPANFALEMCAHWANFLCLLFHTKALWMAAVLPRGFKVIINSALSALSFIKKLNECTLITKCV